MKEVLDPTQLRFNLKWAASLTVGGGLVFWLFPKSFFGMFSGLFVLLGGWQTLWYGSTLIATHLKDISLKIYQLFVVLLFTVGFNACLLISADSIDWDYFSKYYDGIEAILVFAILACTFRYISSIFESKYWFRSYIAVAFALFFVSLFLTYNFGIERTEIALSTGFYAIQYPFFVVSAFIGLLWGTAKTRGSN